MTIPRADKWKRMPEQDMMWEVDDAGAYLVSGGRRWPVKSMGICANGTRDLCIARDGMGELIIAKIEGTPPEMVLGIPDSDIAVFEFHEEIPGASGKVLIIGLNPTFEPLMRHIIQRFPGLKMDLYDAYLGKDYGADQ